MSVTTAPHALVIEGGNPLNGRIRASGNKNGALPILAACLLADDSVTLSNVPRIRDVETMLELLCATGASTEWTGPNEVRVDPRGLASYEVDAVLAERIRASFLLAGPLLARLGRASVPPPGGDVIGRRRLDPHIHALQRLGTRIEIETRFEMQTDGLRGAEIFLEEASVMATENYGDGGRPRTGRRRRSGTPPASRTYRISLPLPRLARRRRSKASESNVLRIRGVETLKGGEWAIAPEHIEVGSFIGLAAVTNSDLRIDAVVPHDMISILTAFSRLGIRGGARRRRWLRVPPDQELVIQERPGRPGAEDRGRPVAGVPRRPHVDRRRGRATWAWGTILVFEKMFENRLFFVDKLVSMGARIIVCDPHRVVVTGPARLYGQRLTSPDIRAGMAMLIAALCADGRSVIGNVGEIDRGYERIDDRLRAVGAQIERVEA